MPISKFIFGLICLSVLLKAPLVNADFDTAISYHVAKNYKAAHKEYLNVVNNPHEVDKESLAIAMSLLGQMHYNGQGVEQNYKLAIYWYRKAAEQGHVNSQYNLALLYEQPEDKIIGVEQNYKLAIYWYRKAAEQGDDKSQHALGYLYAKGQGVEQNYKLAEYWSRKAAEQGHASSQSILGVLYFSGQGVGQDYKLAEYWSRKAADKKNDSAQFNLGLMYVKGLNVEQNYKLAEYWYRKAAEQGHERAQHNLGNMYEHGQGIVQDYKQAFNWYTRAAMQGVKRSQDSLTRLKDKQIAIWSDDLFDNRFFVYNFTDHKMIPDLETTISQSRKNDPSETIKLYGQRIIKKIWIDVEVKLNEDGTIKRDNNDNIASCKIKAKSDNLLLDEDFVGKNCFIEKDIWDRIKDYAW